MSHRPFLWSAISAVDDFRIGDFDDASDGDRKWKSHVQWEPSPVLRM